MSHAARSASTTESPGSRALRLFRAKRRKRLSACDQVPSPDEKHKSCYFKHIMKYLKVSKERIKLFFSQAWRYFSKGWRKLGYNRNSNAFQSIGSLATVGALFFAIYTGYQSIEISSKAVEISESALTLSTELAMPHFTLERLPGFQVGEGGVDQIRIYNDGEVFDNLQVSFISFYEVNFFVEECPQIKTNIQFSILVPLIYFIDFEKKRGEEGLVYVITTKPNQYLSLSSKLKEFYDFQEKLVDKINCLNRVFLNTRSFVRLEYDNRFGIKNVEYFSAEPYYVSPLSTTDGDRLFEEWSSGEILTLESGVEEIFTYAMGIATKKIEFDGEKFLEQINNYPSI